MSRIGIYPIPGTDQKYLPIPKNACTSLKRVLFRRRFGFWYPKTNKRYFGMKFPALIHTMYPSVPNAPCQSDCLINVVLRPVEARLLSILNNRVLHHNDISLSRKPSSNEDLEELLYYINEHWYSLLEKYQMFKHHATPQYDYIKNNLHNLKILTIRDLTTENIFNTLYNNNIEIPHAQKSRPLVSFDKQTLNMKKLENISNYYSHDINYLSNIDGIS